MSEAHAMSSEAHHPGPRAYAMIALVLSVITLIEFWAFYVPWFREIGLFMPMLIVLSAIKFSLVALFYMHLKFDHAVYSRLLVGGVILAAAIMLALLSLFFLAHPAGIV
jgi:cytochrome c oxidase subunit 4